MSISPLDSSAHFKSYLQEFDMFACKQAADYKSKHQSAYLHFYIKMIRQIQRVQKYANTAIRRYRINENLRVHWG